MPRSRAAGMKNNSVFERSACRLLGSSFSGPSIPSRHQYVGVALSVCEIIAAEGMDENEVQFKSDQVSRQDRSEIDKII